MLIWKNKLTKGIRTTIKHTKRWIRKQEDRIWEEQSHRAKVIKHWTGSPKDVVVFPFLEVLEAQLSRLEPLAKDSSKDNIAKTCKAPQVQSRRKAEQTQNLDHLSTSF